MTGSGATAGCSDCHLLNHSNEHVGPLDYTALLFDMARAGSISLLGQILGSLSTHEKQLEKRKEMAEAVHKQMIERNFSACRGCHDLSRMHNAKKPFIAKMHQNLDKDPKKPADCLACHPKAGHDYAAADAEMAKTQETAAKYSLRTPDFLKSASSGPRRPKERRGLLHFAFPASGGRGRQVPADLSTIARNPLLCQRRTCSAASTYCEHKWQKPSSAPTTARRPI